MSLFETIFKAEQATQIAADMAGRSFGITIAIVADIDDPMKLGRIRVATAAKGAKTLSDWLPRLSPSKLISVPLVEVGDTVAVSFINGDPANGVYLGIVNNIPQPPATIIANTVSVNGTTATVQSQKDITFTVGLDSKVELSKDFIKLTLGGATLTLQDGSFTLNGVSSATINGKPIATIGALDTDGDTLTTKGW